MLKPSNSFPSNSVLVAVVEDLEKQPPFLVATVSLLLVLLIATIDYILPFDITLSIFYVIPILVASWFAGPRIGLTIAAISASLWLSSELLLNHDTSVLPLYWNMGVRLGFFLIISYLLSALKQAYDREKRLARSDVLTGVINRRYFQELLVSEFRRSTRFGSPLTLAYIDVDNFKGVNDHYGHSTGDLLLNLIAQSMARQVRAIDVVARLGGDEFVLMLPQTGPNQARVVLPRVQKQLMRIVQQHGWPISFSIGVVTFMAMPETVEDLVNQADHLMYHVKSRGKNRIEYGVFEGAREGIAALR